jgi:hypothetical protein
MQEAADGIVGVCDEIHESIAQAQHSKGSYGNVSDVCPLLVSRHSPFLRRRTPAQLTATPTIHRSLA